MHEEFSQQYNECRLHIDQYQRRAGSHHYLLSSIKRTTKAAEIEDSCPACVMFCWHTAGSAIFMTKGNNHYAFISNSLAIQIVNHEKSPLKNERHFPFIFETSMTL